MDMKAWVLHGIDDIRFETVEKPVPGKGEVLVAVRAAGICGSDIPRIYQTGAHVHPLIPGHEFSGVVEETGPGADESWLGRRVGVFPMIPCRECDSCRRGQYELCRDYGYLGSRRDGGFAEYVSVPAQNLTGLPDNVAFEEAAMLEPMAVAVHAMRRAMPGRTDRVAVWGLGTIGLLLFRFLKEAGVRDILAIGNKDFQKREILKMGSTEDCYFDIRKGPADRWIMERTAGAGVDVFFECVGRNEAFSQAIGNTAPGGRVCLVGNPMSAMKLDRDVYWKILRNQLTVTGTWNSAFASDMSGEQNDWQYVLNRLSGGGVRPGELISHRFSLEELGEGLRIMRDKTEEYAKLMCCVR